MLLPSRHSLPQVTFSQEEQRQCLLAATLLPLRQIKFKAAKGKPGRWVLHPMLGWARKCYYVLCFAAACGTLVFATAVDDKIPLTCPPRSAAHHVVRGSLKWKTKDADAHS